MTAIDDNGPVAIPFADGNVSGTVRLGETVRRAAGYWTPAVHAFLRHLLGAGFTGMPDVLGFDERGRHRWRRRGSRSPDT